jgi:hypothetical protein
VFVHAVWRDAPRSHGAYLGVPVRPFDLANKVEGHVRQRATVALSDQQWAAMPAQDSEPEYEVEALYPSAWLDTEVWRR